MRTTVLVPLDGSPLAERALPYATTLAQARNARLLLLHVAPRQGEPGGDGRLAATFSSLLEEVRGKGITAELRVEAAREGDIARTIVASVGVADLIAMSTHGRGGIDRLLHGSVADQVVRLAPVPVLLVSPVCERVWQAGRAARVLVPLDGSELAEAALGPALDLAGALRAEVHLLQVINPPYFALYPGAVTYIPFDPQAELATTHAYLGRVAARLRADGCSVRAHARIGYPGSELVACARDEAIDLIVMATHGRGGVARLVMGSVASEALQRASVPVVLVRPAAMRREVAEPAEPLVAAAPPRAEPRVTIDFSASELALLRRGLHGLLQAPGRDRHLAEAAEALLARIAEAERALATPGNLSRDDEEVAHVAPQGNGGSAA